MNTKPEEMLKQARENLRLTQAEVADRAGISPRFYQRLESGIFPKFKAETVKAVDGVLGTNVHDLIYGVKFPRETEINEPRPPYLTERQEQKMTISTLMVPLAPIKAQAGYISSHDLFDFIEKLDKFPMAPGINPRGAEWRWFEVAGESMEPTLYEGDYILCSLVPQEDWLSLENYYLYVIVTTGNMWVKRIVKHKGGYVMHSDNKRVKQRPLDVTEVKEIWKVRRHLNARMPAPEKVIIQD